MASKILSSKKQTITPQQQTIPNMINLTPKLEVSPGSFIIIKHGDNKQDIFNINCKVFYLLQNIQKRCLNSIELQHKKKIDLCDLDGNLLNVQNDALKYSYANTLLKSRQTYILVEIETVMPLVIKPLLYNSNLITEEFNHNLIPGVVKKESRKRESRSSANNAQVPKKLSLEKKTPRRTKAY